MKKKLQTFFLSLGLLVTFCIDAQNVSMTLEPDAANQRLDVYLTANGASYTSEIFDGWVFTLRWPASANFDPGVFHPDGFWSFVASPLKQGPEVTHGSYEYQPFAIGTSNTFNANFSLVLNDGVKTKLGHIDITGYASAGLDVCSFKYDNDAYTASNNADFFIQIAGANRTGNTNARNALTSTYTGSWDNCDMANLESGDNAVISSGSYTMTANATLNNLDINPGAALNAGTFSVNASGTITCHADNTGYGQYLGPAVALVFEQYVGTSAGWRHLGIPVAGNIGSVVSLGGAPMNYSNAPVKRQNLFTFNTSTFTWSAIANASTDIGLNGFLAYVGGPYFGTNGTITFTGTSKAGNQSATYNFSSSPVGNSNFDGWNLFANPYPCNLDFNVLDNQDAGAFSSYSIWDAQNSVYSSWNGVLGTNGGQRYIAPGQGIWIKSSGNNGVNLDFTNADRTLSGGNAFVGNFKTSTASTPAIRLGVSSSNGARDEAVIYFPPNSTKAFDQSSGDAFKPWNQNGSNIFSYPWGSNEFLAINAYGDFDPASVIAVGFSGDTASGVSHTISLDLTDLNPTWGTVYLEDLLLNQIHNLNRGSYTFTPSALAPLHRFNISFANSTIGLDHLTGVASDIYAYTKKEMVHLVFVDPTEARADVMMYDLSGQLVHAGKDKSTSEIYSIPSGGLAKGLYIIKVAAANKPMKNIKVLIN